MRIRQGSLVHEEVVTLQAGYGTSGGPYRMMRSAEAFMQERNQGIPIDDRAVLLSVQVLG